MKCGVRFVIRYVIQRQKREKNVTDDEYLHKVKFFLFFNHFRFKKTSKTNKFQSQFIPKNENIYFLR